MSIFSRLHITVKALLLSLIVWQIPAGIADTSTAPAPYAATPEQITDAISDDQLRRVLIQLLQKGTVDGTTATDNTPTASTHEPATGYTDGKYDDNVLNTWSSEVQQQSNEFKTRLIQLKNTLPNLGDDLARIGGQIVGAQYGQGYTTLISMLIAMFAIGWFAERFLGGKLSRLIEKITAQDTDSTSGRFGYAITRIIFEGILIIFFGIAAFSVLVFAVQGDTPMEFALLNLLYAVLVFRAWRVILRAIWAPQASGIRVIQVSDAAAKQAFTWMSVFFGALTVIQYASIVLSGLGLGNAQLIGIVAICTFTTNSYLYMNFWRNRRQITLLFSSDTNESGKEHVLRQVFAQSWPYLFAIWIFSIWALWIYHSFMGDVEAAEAITIAWWVTILFPVTDRALNSLLKLIVKVKWLQSRSFKYRSRRFINVVQSGFRLIALTVSLYVLFDAWGVEAILNISAAVGESAAEGLIDTTVIIVCAYIVWELIQALIERHLPDEPESSEEFSIEGDGGGTGGSRTETLLPLVRSFLITVLVVLVALSVLHNLGVEITPLLAGAGVVGIAVGFGAQKLVQDILSGIFFLIDDAFRRGEYIEIGELRGTVEKISMRSMQLRHHLGAVQTIPYGEIRTVKNVSRDWVMMKLDLRLPYDTDIEKVRKIIKKVGQEMMQDPVIGPDLLIPLKSQGVFRVDESALITRMKFTARPGGQWAARREAYSRVRDALASAGITFAHREVCVRLPKELEQKIIDSDNSMKDTLPTIVAASTGAASAALTTDDVGQKKRTDQ